MSTIVIFSDIVIIQYHRIRSGEDQGWLPSAPIYRTIEHENNRIEQSTAIALNIFKSPIINNMIRSIDLRFTYSTGKRKITVI